MNFHAYVSILFYVNVDDFNDNGIRKTCRVNFPNDLNGTEIVVNLTFIKINGTF